MKEKKRYWCFCHGLDEWREYINTEDECRNTLYCLLKDILVPAQKQGQDLRQAISDHVEAISCKYEQLLLSPDINSFRYHFIHHPGVWDYMETKRCMWTGNNYDIELKTSNGNNSNRMELRTYALYLDYCHNGSFMCDHTGWYVCKWAKEGTCMYFEREISFEQNAFKVAIDVYYFDHQGKRKCEDNYAFDLFIRPTHPDAISEEEELAFAEEDYQANISLFSKLIPELMNVLERKEEGRLRSKSIYSRSGIKDILRQTMQGIYHSTKDNEYEG